MYETSVHITKQYINMPYRFWDKFLQNNELFKFRAALDWFVSHCHQGFYAAHYYFRAECNIKEFSLCVRLHASPGVSVKLHVPTNYGLSIVTPQPTTKILKYA